MRAHRHRQVVERREGRKIAFELIALGVDDGQLEMAVGARPAMAGHVLDDGRDAAGEQAFGDRPAHRRDALRPMERRRALPMAACVPGSATSSTGAQSTVIPTSPRSRAMRRATRRAAASARDGSNPASIAAAAG